MSFAIYPSLEGAVVFVTGGASGIGAEIVRAFAGQGSRVGFVDIDHARGRALADESREAGAEIRFEACDLRDVQDLRRAFAALEDALGPATVLVNNAARDDRHAWQEVTPEYYDERIAANLRHMFFAIQAVAPGMIAAGKGSIINFGSNSWWQAAGGMPVYTTAKAAVHGMTRAFARDLGPHRIRVNTVVPGWVMTSVRSSSG
jgi:NAD(P)-dependent dehydrogenase (short-subunit alcohol dehydrogenase family)